MKYVFLFLTLLLTGCANNLSTSNYTKGNVEITDSDLADHIGFLSSDSLEGRYPGTPGADLAADYIKDAFVSIGLEPAFNGQYFQNFDFVKNVILGSSNSLTFIFDDESFETVETESFMPLAFSSSGSYKGPVAFAGYGFSIGDTTNWEDYKDLDIEGKWAIVFRGGPDDSPHSPYGQHMSLRKKALVARDKKALGLLLVSGSDVEGDELIKLRYDHGFGDAGIPVLHLKRELMADVFERSGYDLAKIENDLKSNMKPGSFVLNGVNISTVVSLEKETVSIPNVAGILRGSDENLSNEIIVIGAHFDHLGWGGEGSSLMPDTVAVHNGADDNASGTAGVIELAEKFAGSESPFKRSIMFAGFNAEEKGSIGSRYMTENFPGGIKSIITMVNLDMVGRLDENKLNISGTGTSPVFPDMLESFNKDGEFSIKMSPEGFGPSDHSNFYINNIPVLFFFTGTHNDYHKPSDDIETLNLEGEARLLNFVFNVVAKLANDDSRPEFTEAGPKENTAARASFKVTFGVIPSYASQAEGMEIDGTRKDGPAEKAGMLKGDIIIAIDGKEVKSIYDYMYRLAELKVGQQVPVVILRGEEKLELILQL